jgi:hypothetical protein
MIPEPKNPESLGPEPLRAFMVFFLFIRMLPAIDLYNHLLFEAHKVHDVRTDRLLSAKLVAIELPVSEVPP